MIIKRSWILALAILGCLVFAWATGAGRPYPANASGVIDPTCTSSLPCIEYDNNSTGPGIRGISVAGNGLAGSTKNNSTSPATGREGLIGNDISTSGIYNAGVRGLSTRGSGVAGQSSSGPGISGVSTSGTGVTAQSASGIGVRGVSSTASGVQGVSNISDAVQGVIGSGVASSFHAGVAGLDSSTSGATNEGVYAQSTNGIGIQAVSFNFIGEQVSGGGSGGGDFDPALSVNGNIGNPEFPPDLIDACNSGGPNPCRRNSTLPAPQFIAFANGNVAITGRIFTSGSCSVGCASSLSAAEKRVRLFTPQESLPTVEDFGQAQLVGGRTYVRIDPAFANTMDKAAPYLVFITPKGDNRGLYVTNESATGFEVRESQAGRATLAFDYRIVAKPFGEHPVRLQMITVSKPGRSLPALRVR
jgi:hypothetical protein